MSAAVHTSAHAEADLFGDPVRPESSTSLVELQGRLEHDAQVRIEASDHGHARPVLCIDLLDVGPGLHRVHVEKPFDHAHRFTVDAMAATLKRGMWVTVSTTWAGSRLTLPQAASIHLANPTTQSHA